MIFFQAPIILTIQNEHMKSDIRIAISIPKTNKTKSRISLKLKQDLSNEPCVYNKPSKILALSDIEGNFMSFLKLLLYNKVIDKYLSWIFEDGHLVIVGDCFDKGEEVMECLWLIYSLEEKARKAGGNVHFILGNHEIMNMNGDWRYVHPRYAQSTSIPYTALYTGNNELWRWLRTKNIMEKIGDVLFVHGGVSPELLQLQISLPEINYRIRPYYSQANQSFDDPLLKIVYNSESSPFWYRGYYKPEAAVAEEMIDATLKLYGVKKIVTGHTVVSQVTSYFNGKVINVDTDHAAGQSEGLLIKRDKYYRVQTKGRRERIK
jgi:hypothetical protein